MRQLNGEGSFLANCGSETPKPIQLKCGMFDYIHSSTPYAKYGGRREGEGWGNG